MSKEYIERGTVVAFLKNMAASRYLIQCFENKEKFPAADVEPVRHGEWIVTEYPNHFDVECSVCKTGFYVYKKGQYRIDHSNHCPHCGAKMDGGNSNA